MIIPITSKKRKKYQEICLGLMLGLFLGIIFGINGIIVFLLILILYSLNERKK